MARTIIEIQNEIYADIAADSTLPNSISNSAIYRRFTFIICYAIWILEILFDTHKKEIDTALYEQKSGTQSWYRNKSLAFQFGYGFQLEPESDRYNNSLATPEDIASSKIIKYCSVKESLESNKLTIKVAGESGSTLIPLNSTEITSFNEYLSVIKYAGVKLNVVNNPADKLILIIAVYRDVLVLDDLGNSIKNAGKPIETAIYNYMKNLPFNGELVLNDLIEKLRAVDGVNNVNILSATSSHWDSVTNDYTPFQEINVKIIPVSGYFDAGGIDNTTGGFVSGNFKGISYVV